MPMLRASDIGLLLHLQSSSLQPLLASLQLHLQVRKALGRASQIRTREERGGQKRATWGQTKSRS